MTLIARKTTFATQNHLSAKKNFIVASLMQLHHAFRDVRTRLRAIFFAAGFEVANRQCPCGFPACCKIVGPELEDGTKKPTLARRFNSPLASSRCPTERAFFS